MRDETQGCLLCRGDEADRTLQRERVWEDDRWRLATVTRGAVPGFSFLEPKRHVPDISALEGPEARTFGEVLAWACSRLKAVTGGQLVYVYVFGGSVPHLHVHLAPHRAGDGLNDVMIKGEVVQETLPSGAIVQVSKDFPPRPAAEHRSVVDRLHEHLGQVSGPPPA